MLPAPRQTTRSPGLAMLDATMPARCRRLGSGENVAVAARAQALDERVAVDASIGGSPAAIDVGDDHDVGVVEAGAELLEQVLQPRVAVRLHDRDHPPLAAPRAARSTAAISTG